MTSRIFCLALCGLALGSVAGCSKPLKDKIAMLNEANRNLVDQLNRMRSDLELCENDVQTLDKQLAYADGDNKRLQAALAARPEPVVIDEPAAPGWTPVPGGAMIAIDDNILFASGKAELRGDAKYTLDAVVNTVRGTYGDKDILVFGHTDDQPIKKSGWTDNWELSAERALAVVRYMREHGVTPGRLVAGGCGEYRPRVPNSGASSRASNRRVEIFAIDPIEETAVR